MMGLLPDITGGHLAGVEPHVRRDGLYAEAAELRDQMKGISPKLGLYKIMADRLAHIEEIVGGQQVDMRALKRIDRTEVIGFRSNWQKHD